MSHIYDSARRSEGEESLLDEEKDVINHPISNYLMPSRMEMILMIIHVLKGNTAEKRATEKRESQRSLDEEYS